MKVPLSWLKKFLPLTETPPEIAARLTALGIEVEAVVGDKVTFSGVVVGKVVEARQHPHADRLRVATVTDGSETFQVVCGAPNCRTGMVTAFARIGAELTEENGNKWKIKKSKIRDVESCGMLCSRKELQVSEEAEGIIELPEETPLGMDVAGVVLDPVFELSITPNLGHAQSVWGVVRELAASYKWQAQFPQVIVRETANEKIDVETSHLCPRFSCCIVKNVHVAPSPAWLQARLISSGLRPVNNLVDAANYVTLELGQPLHIYDYDTMAGDLRVHATVAPCVVVTLDGVKRDVPPGTLLVSDSKQTLGLAGIMGGASSAVTEKTRNILIESAAFDPAVVRKASRLLDLKTDASSRFDKGIDVANTARVLNQVTALILEITGGEACPLVDHYPAPCKARTIPLRPTRAGALLGLHLSENEIIDLLKRLDMQVDSNWNVQIPSYRNDLHIEVDLIEEIARLYGYANFPRPHPVYSTGTLASSPTFLLEQNFRARLLQEGLQECMTCDLISPDEISRTQEVGMANDVCLRVLHPRSQDLSVLRTSLLPGLLQVAHHNFNHGEENLALFEIGRVHFKKEDAIFEPSCAAILLTGLSRPSHFDRKPHAFDFFDLKGMIENILPSFSLEFTPSHLHTLHPWRQAEIKLGALTIGTLGEIHPALAAHYDLHNRPLFAELNLSDLLPLISHEKKFTPFSPFPSSIRDWTISLPAPFPYQKLAVLIQAHTRTPFTLIDSFTQDENKKNLTLRFVYQSQDATVDAETISRAHEKLIETVAEKLSHLI